MKNVLFFFERLVALQLAERVVSVLDIHCTQTGNNKCAAMWVKSKYDGILDKTKLK